MPPNVQRFARQMAARRERILEAAREIIAEQGFEGLTIRALAQAAGVTVPTIYNLVGNKDEVLVAAVAEQTERFLRGIQRAPGDVLSIVDANLRELHSMPRYYRSLLRLMMSSKAAGTARRTVSEALGGQLHAALAELAEGGGLEPWVDLERLADQIQATLAISSQLWAHGAISDAELEARERHGVALLMLGVTKGAARREYRRIAERSQGRGARRRASATPSRAGAPS